MTNEDNDQAQLMRDKARENSAFYYPKTIEGLESKVRELEAKVSFTESLERLRDDLASQLKEAKTEVADLKAQLAQTQAACASLRYTAKNVADLIELVEGVSCRRWVDEQGTRLKDTEQWAVLYVQFRRWQQAYSDDIGKGWLSPDEAAKLKAQCEFYRQETHHWKEACNKSDAKSHELSAQCSDYKHDCAQMTQQLIERGRKLERFEKSLCALVADCERIAKGDLLFSIIDGDGKWRTLEIAREALKGGAA